METVTVKSNGKHEPVFDRADLGRKQLEQQARQ
jgi:hypothetical protein